MQRSDRHAIPRSVLALLCLLLASAAACVEHPWPPDTLTEIETFLGYETDTTAATDATDTECADPTGMATTTEDTPGCETDGTDPTEERL